MERWILVIRDTQNDETWVWTNNDLRRVVAQAMKYRSKRAKAHRGGGLWKPRPPCIKWERRPDVDAWLLTNYPALSFSECAKVISKMMDRKVSKCACVGRHRRLKERAQLGTNGVAVDQATGPMMNVDGKLDTYLPVSDGFTDGLLTNSNFTRET